MCVCVCMCVRIFRWFVIITLSDMDEINKRKKPEFSSKLVNKTVTEGSELKLTCKVKGYPKPTVTWLQEESDLTTAEFCTTSSEGSSQHLHIKSVSLDHGGSFTCRLNNIVGMAECSCNILVEPAEIIPEVQKPSFTVGLTDVTATRNGTAVFTCRASGEPTPKLSWYHDRDLLMVNTKTVIFNRGPIQ